MGYAPMAKMAALVVFTLLSGQGALRLGLCQEEFFGIPVRHNKT